MASPPTPNVVALELGMPHATLTPLPEGTQSHPKKLWLLLRELFANTQAVPATLGGANHGHLALVMTALDYLLLGGEAIAYVPPNPDVRPVIAAGTTAVKMTNAMSLYAEAKEIYKIHRQVSTNIKALILVAVSHVYINALADPMHGLNNVTPLQILTYLDTIYGTITPEHLAKNEALLLTPWDINEPTKPVFDVVDKIQAFATAGRETIANGKAVHGLVSVLEQSGAQGDAVKDWKKKTAANQTLANLRTHMHEHN